MKDDDREIRRKVQELFTLERPSGGKWSRYDSTDWYGIMHGMNDLFNKTSQALQKGCIHKAAGMPLQWLSSFAENFTEEAFEYDDEGVEFADDCETAGEIIIKAEIFIAEGDFQALHDYLCDKNISFFIQLNMFQEYAGKLPMDLQPDVAALYGEAIREYAKLACNRDTYVQVRRHIERLLNLQGSAQLVKGNVAELKDEHHRQYSFMKELDKIMVGN